MFSSLYIYLANPKQKLETQFCRSMHFSTNAIFTEMQWYYKVINFGVVDGVNCNLYLDCFVLKSQPIQGLDSLGSVLTTMVIDKSITEALT